MVKKRAEEVKSLVRKIEEFKHSHGYKSVILFGSYSRGDFDDDSDVDLMIVDKRFEGHNVFSRTKGMWIDWHTKLNAGKAVDFLCYTPAEFSALKKKVSIVSEAVREGISI
jgi:predicted nucleotidyltransferase